MVTVNPVNSYRFGIFVKYGNGDRRCPRSARQARDSMRLRRALFTLVLAVAAIFGLLDHYLMRGRLGGPAPQLRLRSVKSTAAGRDASKGWRLPSARGHSSFRILA